MYIYAVNTRTPFSLYQERQSRSGWPSSHNGTGLSPSQDIHSDLIKNDELLKTLRRICWVVGMVAWRSYFNELGGLSRLQRSHGSYESVPLAIAFKIVQRAHSTGFVSVRMCVCVCVCGYMRFWKLVRSPTRRLYTSQCGN